jgi:hypothetical protein
MLLPGYDCEFRVKKRNHSEDIHSEAWFNTHRTKGSSNLWFELASRRPITRLMNSREPVHGPVGTNAI